MGSPYTLNVVVEVPPACPVPREITLSGGETGYAPASDELRGDLILSVLETTDGQVTPKHVIDPTDPHNNSVTFQFTGKHTWDWTDHRNTSCLQYFTEELTPFVLLGVAGKIPDATTKAAEAITNLGKWGKAPASAIDDISDTLDLVPRRAYGLSFTARGPGSQDTHPVHSRHRP
jgi:hypothetical protein